MDRMSKSWCLIPGSRFCCLTHRSHPQHRDPLLRRAHPFHPGLAIAHCSSSFGLRHRRVVAKASSRHPHASNTSALAFRHATLTAGDRRGEREKVAGPTLAGVHGLAILDRPPPPPPVLFPFFPSSHFTLAPSLLDLCLPAASLFFISRRHLASSSSLHHSPSLRLFVFITAPFSEPPLLSARYPDAPPCSSCS